VDEDGGGGGRGKVGHRSWERGTNAGAMLLSSNRGTSRRSVVQSAPRQMHVTASGWRNSTQVAAQVAAVFFTDVGRKLRQERFASALLVLRVEPLIAPVRCMPIGLSTPSAVAVLLGSINQRSASSCVCRLVDAHLRNTSQRVVGA
jgi:hypothetical protein